VLNNRYGTLIRRNGQFVGEDASYEHGDLIEYHVGHQQQLIIDKRCDKVQICLDSVLEHVAPHFDIEADAVEVLPYPSIQKDLCNEDAWVFQLIPEGTPLHKETFEALHCQRALDNSTAYRYELYIDGATSNGLSAWAVVAVSVFGDERCFLGCVAGLTEINQSSPKWIGALNHTNIDAELSAMAVATAFAFFASGEAQVLIRPDLALSQQFLNIQSTTRQLSTLARVIHVLGLSKPSGVDVQEVRAHRGDPWNELADAIARHVVATGKEVGSIPWTWLNQIATSPSTIKWE
jgi:ribonuclease HI